MATPSEVRETLEAMQLHPHDHGWHSLYALIGRIFGAEEITGGGPLTRITQIGLDSRPNLTPSHFVTLLCIAVKETAGDWRDVSFLDQGVDFAQRTEDLACTIESHESSILERVLTRQNSFSSARRFLIPQVLISRFAARAKMRVRLADLGTGAGLLPRQLNSRSNYDRFASGLTWHGWNPSFVEVPYEVRWGIDRTPVQDLAWIRHCYGPSRYYDELYAELKWAFEQPDVRDAKLHMADVDLVESDKLARFLSEKKSNVVTCSFVLYQYDHATRNEIVASVVSTLQSPGLFVSLEPTGDLLTPGAFIRVYLPGTTAAIEIGRVSDGHCVGEVAAGRDLSAFLCEYL